MSKVHAALKKAAEEHTSARHAGKHNGTGTHTSSMEAGPAVTIPIGSTSPPALMFSAANPAVEERRTRSSMAGLDAKSEQRLRFEELVKNCTKPAWTLDRNAVLFSESNGAVPGAEQFRTLRSRLYRLRETAPLKKLLVTSATNGEGKTFISTNLAQAIACERDRPVLLIDADLRSPKLHLPLGAPLSPGLSDYLSGGTGEKAIIQHGASGNLCFIGAGDLRGSPSELLSNGLMEKLLGYVAPFFEWIIVDSPPCLPVADASMLARMCDGVLLVVRARYAPSAAVQTAYQELRGRNVIGVALNAVEKNDHLSYGYGASNGHKSLGVGR